MKFDVGFGEVTFSPFHFLMCILAVLMLFTAFSGEQVLALILAAILFGMKVKFREPYRKWGDE